MWEWTEERIQELKQLWADGMSGLVIANEFGISRNAVIGKVTRLKLPPRHTKVSHKPQHKRQLAGVSLRKKSKTPALSAHKSPSLPSTATLPDPKTGLAKAAPLGLPILDLEAHHCKWPFNFPGDKDFHFCGATRVDGKPYCEKHCAEAYTGVSARRPQFPVRNVA